jgi:hypothetical protein
MPILSTRAKYFSFPPVASDSFFSTLASFVRSYDEHRYVAELQSCDLWNLPSWELRTRRHRGANFLNTDFSVAKNTRIREQFNLQFRSEFFDEFNHPNFGNSVLTTTSESFGRTQSTRFPTGDFGSARQIQFALKLLF